MASYYPRHRLHCSVLKLVCSHIFSIKDTKHRTSKSFILGRLSSADVKRTQSFASSEQTSRCRFYDQAYLQLYYCTMKRWIFFFNYLYAVMEIKYINYITSVLFLLLNLRKWRSPQIIKRSADFRHCWSNIHHARLDNIST